jgi:hypothetical protein
MVDVPSDSNLMNLIKSNFYYFKLYIIVSKFIFVSLCLSETNNKSKKTEMYR